MTEAQRYGQDELNLVDLAFATLSASGSRKTLEVEWTGTDETGVSRRFFKIVTGTDKFGLPDYPAEELLLALLYESSQAGFTSPLIDTSPAELLDLMEWGKDGRYYQRLRKALNQLVGVKIYTNALWDVEKGCFVEAAFGIIDRYRLERSPVDKRKSRLLIKWSDDIFQQFQQKQFKRLDLSFFYSLRSTVSKRLYRWVDKHSAETGRAYEDLKTLAHAKLLVGRSRDAVSGIMQILEPALQEFEERRYCRASLEDYPDRPGDKVIVFERLEKPEMVPEGPVSELIDQLCKRGIAGTVARDLVAMHSVDRILRQIEHYDYLCRIGRTPETAGWLVKAVQRDFDLPAKLVKQQERRKRQEARQAQLEFELLSAVDEKRQRANRFDHHFKALSEQEQEMLERRAIEMLEPFARSLLDKGGPDRPTVRALIRENMEVLLLDEEKKGPETQPATD